MVATYIWINIIIFLLGYWIGSINLGIIVSKIKGQDIRSVGSNNAGATNVLRIMGFKFAATVFTFDLLKAYIPILIVSLCKKFINVDNAKHIIPLFIGLGALIGHIFPIYFKFKGGKGVACFFGITLGFHLYLFMIFVAIYVTIIAMTEYVSLASTITPIIVSLLSIWSIFGTGVLGYMQVDIPINMHSIILSIATIFILLKHFKNFQRLLNKTENKLNLY
ncbi:G3P acyltransferase [Metamycoplasma cloacale]|uniref:Glycerol-3-phosphate acyltransferase n=1 Tax=Metamycoplasma cloacale TaxID=92401 RepID=A0A2Z4LL84_9BACT|nr:glycerol-3-phosphate 1-O-acyltransferase PlsY [Metamycoplasma cloacale]AWX42489.1 acyl-phosphate glycerol 3-phosphate acyltransferase [Metamycoplasma cloacale]VEU79165.1 G3P acyltransferase [Metamycoplasma cloacale]